MEEITKEDHAISMVAFDWFYKVTNSKNRPIHEHIFMASIFFARGNNLLEDVFLNHIDRGRLQEFKELVDNSFDKGGMLMFVTTTYNLNKEKKDGLGYLAGFLLNYLFFENIRKHYDEKKSEVVLEYIVPKPYNKKQLCELFNETPQRIRQALELLSLKKLIKLDKKNNLVFCDLNKIAELVDM